jgi:hypothetical protein
MQLIKKYDNKQKYIKDIHFQKYQGFATCREKKRKRQAGEGIDKPRMIPYLKEEHEYEYE